MIEAREAVMSLVQLCICEVGLTMLRVDGVSKLWCCDFRGEPWASAAMLVLTTLAGRSSTGYSGGKCNALL